jgi:thiamine-phosphate pyrophosphorylase
MNRDTRVALLEDIDIYPVTCKALSAGRSNIEVLKCVISGGAKIIQLREKHYSKRNLYQEALSFRRITAEAGILLIINDHLDIAMAVGADGVHLGQDDLPLSEARKLAPDLLIGASSHCLEQAIQAEKDGADYINIGPIFPTKTKEKLARFLGPTAIPAISSRINRPFTVMGGINPANIDQVIAQGARRIAMVTGITKADDISETVKMLRAKILQDTSLNLHNETHNA